MPQKAAKKAAFTQDEGGKHGLGLVVLDDLIYQFEEPMAITGNTTEHEQMKDKSIVVWTNWKTEKGDSVIVPIRIDANGQVGVYNNVNTVFDANNPEYVADLLREGNVLYTKNGENIFNLLEQRRQVPKLKDENDLSEFKVTDEGEKVKQRFSAADTEEQNAGGEVPEYLTDIEKALEQSGAEVYTPETLDAVLKDAGLTDEAACRKRNTLHSRKVQKRTA